MFEVQTWCGEKIFFDFYKFSVWASTSFLCPLDMCDVPCLLLTHLQTYAKSFEKVIRNFCVYFPVYCAEYFAHFRWFSTSQHRTQVVVTVKYVRLLKKKKCCLFFVRSYDFRKRKKGGRRERTFWPKYPGKTIELKKGNVKIREYFSYFKQHVKLIICFRSCTRVYV